MRTSLVFPVLAVAAVSACTPYTFTAPTPTPDYVAGNVSAHTFWVERTGVATTATCTHGVIAEVSSLCIQGVRSALENGLHVVLATQATAAQLLERAEFVARFPEIIVHAQYGRDGYRLELGWSFELDTRDGRVVVALRNTEFVAATSEWAIPFSFLDAENAALRHIADAVARSQLVR